MNPTGMKSQNPYSKAAGQKGDENVKNVAPVCYALDKIEETTSQSSNEETSFLIVSNQTKREFTAVTVTQEDLYKSWHIHDDTCDRTNAPNVVLTVSLFLIVFLLLFVFEWYK